VAEKLPAGIRRDHLIEAIRDIENGVTHSFGESIGYDILYEGRRYPPKAVVGLAATRVTGRSFLPKDFRGGIGTQCFRILIANGLPIVPKVDTIVAPEEVDSSQQYIEGATIRVDVNRYERDLKARAACIAYHGATCSICAFSFTQRYGPLGEGFVHVHHLKPISSLRSEYRIDPIEDLTPVCPNCHAMLHRTTPPLTPDELRALMKLQDKPNYQVD
jgi:5-methylcytosine-specific restriction protein A